MSRVIKSAVMHGEPKIVENSGFLPSERDSVSDEDNLLMNKVAVAATCAVMLDESKKKSAEIIEAAEKHRQACIDQAKLQAEEVIEQAKAEAERMKNDAYEEGKNAGYAEGEANGRLEAETKMKALIDSAAKKAEQIIKLSEIDSKNSILSAETKIVEIAMAIADKVIPQHFIDAPQIIFPLVKTALEKVKDQNSIVVRVSAENYEFLLMAKNELQMVLDGEEKLEIVSDQLLRNDGCIIESANGNVDARLETQMAIVKKAVQEVIDDGYSN